MAQVGRRKLLLLLIGLNEGGTLVGTVSGITRLQKLLFLLEREGGVLPSGSGFEFEPYKAGPYSSKLYDDLELLENLGLIRTEAAAESTITEAIDIDRLSFEDLMGGFDELDGGSRAADSFEERRFSLTEEGGRKARQLLESGEHAEVVEGIRTVKAKFNHYSLRDLLRYVYRKHPDMISESEIIDQVLGRRGE